MVRSHPALGIQPMPSGRYLATLRCYRRMSHPVSVSLPILAGSSSRTTGQTFDKPDFDDPAWRTLD
jgi:hypothetical protein